MTSSLTCTVGRTHTGLPSEHTSKFTASSVPRSPHAGQQASELVHPTELKLYPSHSNPLGPARPQLLATSVLLSASRSVTILDSSSERNHSILVLPPLACCTGAVPSRVTHTAAFGRVPSFLRLSNPPAWTPFFPVPPSVDTEDVPDGAVVGNTDLFEVPIPGFRRNAHTRHVVMT